MKQKSTIQARRAAIKQLITTEPIQDQHTLITRMRKQYGITASQAIISRDLYTMGIAKRKIKNKVLYDLPATDASKEILRLAIVSIMHNEALIIIQTLPALAAFVADYLDMQEDPHILGVLAGENTVFITPTTTTEIVPVYETIKKLLYFHTTA